MKYPGRILLLAVALLVLTFDVWTVRSSGDPWKWGAKQKDYYNLLIDGWLEGQLAMKIEVPDALLKLSDPYDPKQRAVGLGLHDASFYHGRYFLYFGAAPVVTLMLPFRVLTRIDLPQAVAVIVFVYGGFLASAAVWLRLRRKYFPESGAMVSALCVLALGFASLGPVLLRRPHVWELPIGAAYCFAMLTLLAVFESLHATRGEGIGSPTSRSVWFAAAGLFLGLAVASRPTYLAALPLLFAPVIWWWREEKRVPWRVALCGLAPLVSVGALMALHNFLRFGNPLEFGQNYQFSSDYESKMPHFRAGYLGFNTWRYFFSAAQWSKYFPFIAPAALPPLPAGQGGTDDVYGIFTNLPIAWFALAAPFAVTRRTREERGRLFAWLGAAMLLFAGMAAMLLCYFGSLVRYEFELASAPMLLACIGVLACERLVRERPRVVRIAVRVGWGGAALVSAVFAVVFSLQVNRLLPERSPANNRAVARVLNQVPAWIERIVGAQPSAWELELWLPRASVERTETLLSVGDPPEVDRVFVRTIDATHVQLGFARTAMPDVGSAPVAFNVLQTHRVRVTLGAFLPPDTHPWFADAPADVARRTSRILRLELDGKIVAQTFRRFDTVAGGRVRVGAKSLGDTAHPRFSGELIATRRVPVTLAELTVPRMASDVADTGDTFELKLKFPRERTSARDPVVVTGRTGQGDLLGVEYLAGSQARFVLDHWGSLTLRSEPFRIDATTEHAVVVRFPWLTASTNPRVEQRGDLQVELDGAVIWKQSTMGFLADPEEIGLGRNAIGGGNWNETFSGEVLAARRTDSSPARPIDPTQGGRGRE